MSEHKRVHSTGNHGGFTKAPGHEDGPGYPMSEHGAQEAKNGGRQGGRQSGSSHANKGHEETFMQSDEKKE